MYKAYDRFVALAADIRLASKSAVFGLPEVTIGILAGARQMAQPIAKRCAPRAVEAIKKCVVYGQNMDLASGLRLEGELWALLYSTEDQREGMTAFMEKRPPNFKGR